MSHTVKLKVMPEAGNVSAEVVERRRALVKNLFPNDAEEVEHAVLNVWSQDRSGQPAPICLPCEPSDEYWTDNYYVHLDKLVGYRQVPAAKPKSASALSQTCKPLNKMVSLRVMIDAVNVSDEEVVRRRALVKNLEPKDVEQLENAVLSAWNQERSDRHCLPVCRHICLLSLLIIGLTITLCTLPSSLVIVTFRQWSQKVKVQVRKGASVNLPCKVLGGQL